MEWWNDERCRLTVLLLPSEWSEWSFMGEIEFNENTHRDNESTCAQSAQRILNIWTHDRQWNYYIVLSTAYRTVRCPAKYACQWHANASPNWRLHWNDAVVAVMWFAVLVEHDLLTIGNATINNIIDLMKCFKFFRCINSFKITQLPGFDSCWTGLKPFDAISFDFVANRWCIVTKTYRNSTYT